MVYYLMHPVALRSTQLKQTQKQPEQVCLYLTQLMSLQCVFRIQLAFFQQSCLSTTTGTILPYGFTHNQRENRKTLCVSPQMMRKQTLYSVVHQRSKGHQRIKMRDTLLCYRCKSVSSLDITSYPLICKHMMNSTMPRVYTLEVRKIVCQLKKGEKLEYLISSR